MVVGFTTIYAISEFKPCSDEVYSIQYLYNNVVLAMTMPI